ncbi:MAG: flagellar biosynthesis anti-sigma factor FlgM [Oleiphilaceae bacterium]|nr:flagellar biosynthesis anti-sigma factor FlgM [Oleiphilaceae bacterium]
MAIDFNSVNNNPANAPKPVNKDRTGGAPSQPAQDAPKAAPQQGTNVSLSESARTLTEAQNALAQQPEIDDSKVESIRQALADGSFKMDAEEVARKMLDMDDSIFR